MSSRAALKTPGSVTPTTYSCGDVELDCGARVAHVAGQRQLLTFSEFELLRQLVQSRDQVLTREELRSRWRRHQDSSPRAVDTLVARLRRKLRDAEHFRIETVQQVGYRCHWVPSTVLTLGTNASRTAPPAASRRSEFMEG